MPKFQKYQLPEAIQVPKFSESNGFYTTAQRSAMMAKIGGKDTAPERLLAKALWHCGLRFRRNVRTLPGRPDIAIKKLKMAIFVDGAFWHGYDWENKREKIKSNRKFWWAKIERNRQRDALVNQQLHKMGYTVLRFWDFEVKQELGRCMLEVLRHWEAREYFPKKPV